MKELNSDIKISDYLHDREESYKLDNTSSEWVNKLRDELENAANSERLGEGVLLVNLTIERKHNHTYKDYLIVDATFSASYTAACVKCLEEMQQDLKGSFSSIFLNSNLENNEEYLETITLFSDKKERELYFFKRKGIDLLELVHEHLFLEVDPFPLHHEDCLGLCHICGTNLNKNKCKHHK